MKREIKFRCWDVQGQKMFIPTEIPNDLICSVPEDDDEQFFVHLQFIDLLDKNGKEIYEGDIVSGWRKGSNSDRSYTGILEWNIQQCGFVIRCGKFIMEILSLAMSGGEDSTRLDSFEVVGNIYETPKQNP